MLLLLPILLPLLAALLFAHPRTRRVGPCCSAIVPLLPLGFAIAAGEFEEIRIPWVLLETELFLDGTGRVFLFLTAALWLGGGIFALGYHCRDQRQVPFWLFFLFAMAGNFGLVLAADMVSFYLFFALMSFSAFGLIIHDRKPESLRAGRVYVVLVVVGEVLLFLGLVGAAEASGSYRFADTRQVLGEVAGGSVILGLLILGFGVKAGLVPLHVWLPLAHPAAPTAASAILSGAMIKAGLLGWLRVLPLGIQDVPEWGSVLIVLGTVAMFGGALVGMVQAHPKVILAYSSISQMGMMTVVVGAGLLQPSLWQAASSVLLLFALHHGLAKGALFLAIGLVARPLPLAEPRLRPLFAAGLLAPACSLAGVPGTSGALVKSALKYAIPAGNHTMLDWAMLGLTWGAVGTSLLMIRYLWKVSSQLKWSSDNSANEGMGAMHCGWILLVGASVGLVGVSLSPLFHQAAQSSWSGAGLWSGSWPWVLALLLAILAGWYRKSLETWRRWVPPAGDLLIPATWLLRQAMHTVAPRKKVDTK